MQAVKFKSFNYVFKFGSGLLNGFCNLAPGLYSFGLWWAWEFAVQTIIQVGPGALLYSKTSWGVRATERRTFCKGSFTGQQSFGAFAGLTNKAWDGRQL